MAELAAPVVVSGTHPGSRATFLICPVCFDGGGMAAYRVPREEPVAWEAICVNPVCPNFKVKFRVTWPVALLTRVEQTNE